MIFSERLDGANFNITRINKPLRFGAKARAFRQKMNQMTLRMGKMASEHVQANHRAQGFIDGRVQRWDSKKNPDGRPILTKTGRMKATTKISSRTRNQVKLSTPAPYAWVHNRPVYGPEIKYEGGRYPGRMFMGHSKTLAEATKKMIVTQLNLAART